MTGVPVTIVAKGGVPITPVPSGAPLVTSVPEFGAPVTITSNATPFVIEGYGSAGEMGPLDYNSTELGAFNDFSREFDLATDAAILGMAAYYTGDPVITIEHGGDPLTVVHMEKNANGMLSLVAAGRGLTAEVANLTIKVTGGSVGGGAFRINEMASIQPGISGWTGGEAGNGSVIPTMTVAGSAGGVIKLAFACSVNDPSNQLNFTGAEKLSGGHLITGTPVVMDYTATGPWELGDGWSWDGDDLVHTGPSSEVWLPYTIPDGARNPGIVARGVISEGGNVTVHPVRFSGASFYAWPYDGPMCCGVSSGAADRRDRDLWIRATGDVRLTSVRAVYDHHNVSWAFGLTDAVDGKEISGVTTYRPQWSITATEILGVDY